MGNDIPVKSRSVQAWLMLQLQADFVVAMAPGHQAPFDDDVFGHCCRVALARNLPFQLHHI